MHVSCLARERRDEQHQACHFEHISEETHSTASGCTAISTGVFVQPSTRAPRLPPCRTRSVEGRRTQGGRHQKRHSNPRCPECPLSPLQNKVSRSNTTASGMGTGDDQISLCNMELLRWVSEERSQILQAVTGSRILWFTAASRKIHER